MIDKMLPKMIVQNNPQQIQKYVKKQLPNNPQSLERIYHELASFSEVLNQVIQDKNKLQEKNPKKSSSPNKNKTSSLLLKKSVSSKSISKRVDYYEHNKPEAIAKRHQNLTRSLKQKGFQPNAFQLPLGLTIVKKQQTKIAKPLQISKRLYLDQKDSQIQKCIQRYNINKDFYSNNIKDGNIDGQKFYDRNMKKFLDMRTSSLVKINAKEQYKIENESNLQPTLMRSKSFLNTNTKIFPKSTKTLVSEDYLAMSPQKKKIHAMTQRYKQKRRDQAQDLINFCTNALQDPDSKQPKMLLSQTKSFRQIKQRTEKIIGNLIDFQKKLDLADMETSDKSKEIETLSKQYKNHKLIEKYTLFYLQSIKSKKKHDSILANKKDLVRNQAKFRNLIQEQAK